MVKIQKPIPKKMGNKPKLDNPIKQKKQQQKKEKSATTNKAKLLDDSTPVKKAKVSLKPSKEVTKKQPKEKLNGVKKVARKPLVLAPPESPEQKQNGKVKKNFIGKGKNVMTNGVAKMTKSTEVSEKSNKKIATVEKARVSEKPTKQAKEVKVPAANPTKAKAVPALVPTKETAPQKKVIAIAQKKPESAAIHKKGIAPVPVAPQAAQKKPQSAAPPKKVIAPAPVQPMAAVAQKKPENAALQIPTKPGKKQTNKKKASSEPEPEPTPSIEKIKKVKKPKAALQEKKLAKIAFQKAKLAAKDDEPQKEKKSKGVGTTFRYDPIPYDEDRFNAIVNAENIKKIAEALKSIVDKEVQTKKSSIFDDYRYFLQISSFKIASVPKRMVRLHLKHSLVDKDDDVLLVVPDLKRGGRVDYEPTKHHYEDLLREKGVEGITVMPMNQLRREYRSFEQKRRLCASYEYFMCDGRIVAHVGSMVGRLTQKTRNTFHAVRLNEDKDIKSEIEKSLKKTAFRQLDKSSLHSIPVGSHKFSAEQLADNIELVVDQLKKNFPGGLGNIRNLHLKIGLTGTSSLPLYMSMAQAPDETPSVIGKREERMIKLKREANEVLSKFTMTKEGKMFKLTKSGVEKKRKVQQMKTALKKAEDEEPAEKKPKQDEEDSADDGKKKKKVSELKELELPENEDEDDDTSDEDEEDVIQLGQGSDDEDDETEDDGMANLDEEDTESGAEIVENGLVDEDDEESEEDDEQEVNENENDEDDDDEDEDDDDDDEDDEEESD